MSKRRNAAHHPLVAPLHLWRAGLGVLGGGPLSGHFLPAALLPGQSALVTGFHGYGELLRR